MEKSKIEHCNTIYSLIDKDLCKVSVEARKKTFSGMWKNNFVSIDALAQAGFIYRGPYDKVECIFCKGSIQRWDVGDDDDEDPATLHDYAFPYCSNASPTLARPIPNFNTLLRYEPKPGFIRIYQTSTEARRKSFDHRWYDRNFPAQDLAESGFVYVTDQKIRCVFCYLYIDCRLKETDPYAIHERRSPRCNSLFKIKKYMGYYEERLIRLDSYPEYISLDVKRNIAKAGLYFADFYNAQFNILLLSLNPPKLQLIVLFVLEF